MAKSCFDFRPRLKAEGISIAELQRSGGWMSYGGFHKRLTGKEPTGDRFRARVEAAIDQLVHKAPPSAA